MGGGYERCTCVLMCEVFFHSHVLVVFRGDVCDLHVGG